MRFGLNTFLYASPFTTESVGLFTTLAEWGFDTVEISVEALEHIDPVKVKAAADAGGIAVGSVCAAMGPGRDFRGTDAEAKETATYVTGLIDLAVAMGARTIGGPIYSPVGRIGSHTDAEKQEHFDLVVQNLQPLAKYAVEKGVALTVEPLNRFETDFLNTIDQTIDLVKAVGSNLRIHFDTFHQNIEEKFIHESILKAGDLVGHFRLGAPRQHRRGLDDGAGRRAHTGEHAVDDDGGADRLTGRDRGWLIDRCRPRPVG
jgi:D-psicose/D-tagatose/L-ribulose 3-epimerase